MTFIVGIGSFSSKGLFVLIHPQLKGVEGSIRLFCCCAKQERRRPDKKQPPPIILINLALESFSMLIFVPPLLFDGIFHRLVGESFSIYRLLKRRKQDDFVGETFQG